MNFEDEVVVPANNEVSIVLSLHKTGEEGFLLLTAWVEFLQVFFVIEERTEYV